MGYADNVRRAFGFMLRPGKESKVNFTIKDSLLFYYQVVLIPLALLVIFGIARVHFGPGGTAYMSLKETTAIYDAAYVPGGFSPMASVFAYLVLSNIEGALASYLFIGIGALMLLVIVPAGILIDAGVLHAIGKKFLQAWKGKYESTVAAVMFATLPLVLFYWLVPVPWIALIGVFVLHAWSLVALVIALAAQQSIDRTKAFAIVTCLIILALLVFIPLYMIFVSYGSVYN